MENNIGDILLNQKSLERIVETKFHDMVIKVTELTTTVNQLKREVDAVPLPSSSDDDYSPPLHTDTQFRTQGRNLSHRHRLTPCIASALTRSSNYTFSKNVINPYPPEVMNHPRTIDMHDEDLNIHDVQGPKNEGSEKARLGAMEQDIFKCQGMVERGLSANHLMILNFIREHKMDIKEIVG
ncbi:40S ribosomal protein S5-1 [Hordeum vulgare]|nr:40S ribosomal protein S5-1 [Hordeum vulgare]